MLLTVAGSSCSGKTTAAAACRDVERLVVHDFDEIGVPSDANPAWRQRAMQRWLERALELQDQGVDLLLVGQSPLGEVLAAPSAVHLDGIAACLLDVADHERLRRLAHRDPGRWSPDAAQAFVGWAHWHRRHAVDPAHRHEVITSAGWPEMVWRRWLHWTSGDPRWRVRVIDTTGRPTSETGATLRQWVTDSRNEQTLGRPPLRSGWSDR
ncbi:hypothetical protein ACFY3U_20945 [Micromonospora sp. NPDC000089]|uniref:hypothetical protein n=1 Tax=unclassified Micromonospora TaxID=2617518 RepID=UPI0036CCD416